MATLPDFDALALSKGMMFEKAKSLQVPDGVRGGTSRAEPGFAGAALRRAGDALRVVEWSELTARLNAARDLRLLLRTESQAPIEAVAASFGDAAASYFALLDHDEPAVNRDALGQWNVPGAKVGHNEAERPGHAEGTSSDAPLGDARDMQ
jgi:hypothetical protein